MTEKEAIGRIQEHRRIHSKKEPFTPYLDEAFDMAIEALKQERPHGTWRMTKGRVDKAICGHCGMLSIVEPFGKPPYCQWCGASMRERR